MCVCTILILINNLHGLTSLQRTLVLLLLIIVSNCHIPLKDERSTDLLNGLRLVLLRLITKRGEKEEEEERERGGRRGE